MKQYLLPKDGQFYKTNLHCHTTVSDGKQTPEEVKESYKAQGYAAVCFTDHEVLISQKELCDKDFVALHGYEIAIKKDIAHHTGCFMPVYHFNLIAKKQDNLTAPLFYYDNPSYPGAAKSFRDKVQFEDTIQGYKYETEWLNEYIKTVSERGFLVTYNHPQWSLQNLNDYIGLRGLHAIEVINGGCAREHYDSTSIHFEQMLRAGQKVLPVGGDDNHNMADRFLAWTMIKAKDLTYDALMEAYEKGACYASEGPELLELFLEDGKIHVKTSPAARIILCGEGRYRISVTDTDEAVFDYAPEQFGRYFRIEVRDAKGKHAFSRAYELAEIQA